MGALFAFASEKKRKQRGRAESDSPAAGTPQGAREQGGAAGMPLFLQRAAAPGGLSLGEPGDAFEREADEVAERVVSGASRPADRGEGCACGTRGGGCEACRRARPTLQRRAAGQADAVEVPPSVHETLNSSGRPLDRETRGLMEANFGQDFGDVRVHTDARAGESAHEVDALAYTVGREIVFREGHYAPESSAGRALLAHELTHVIQQGPPGSAPAVIQRQQADAGAAGMTDSSAPRSVVAPPGPDASTEGSASTAANASAAADSSYDPCAVDERGLTNEAFLATVRRATAFVQSHHRDHADYFAYRNLVGRLSEERRRRVQMGHLWLAQNPSAVPERLYQLQETGPSSISVSHADAGAARGAPSALGSPVMTPSQFDGFLERMNVPRIDVEGELARLSAAGPQAVPVEITQQAVEARQRAQRVPDLYNFLGPPGGSSAAAPALSVLAGSGAYASPFGMAAGSPFSLPVGDAAAWRGPLGTTSFTSQNYGLNYVNLDRRYESIRRLYGATRYDFPIYDAISRSGGTGERRVVSVGTRDDPAIPATAMPDFSTGKYGEGMVAMFRPSNPRQLRGVVIDLNVLFNLDFDTARLVNQSYLAVNEDHVAAYRTYVTNDIEANPQNYRQLIDVYLSDNPVTINGQEYRTLTSLEAARRARTIQAADVNAAVRTVGPVAAGRVIGNGITTQELRNMLQFRQQYPNIGPRQFRAIATPELIDAARAGVNTTSSGGRSVTSIAPEAAHAAARQNASRGAAAGSALTGALSLYQLAADPNNQPLSQRLTHAVTDTAVAGAAGYGTAYAESRLNIMMGQALLNAAERNAAVPGAAGLFSAAGVGGRAFLSGGMAAIAAPATTALSLAIDDALFEAHHSSSDYWALTARAAASGSLAAGGGALATAGYGALAGTEGGPVGMLIGFGVGLVIFFAADNTIGESVEGMVREPMERGCPR